MENKKIYIAILWLLLIISIIWNFMFIAIATIGKGLITQAILVFCLIYMAYFSVIGLMLIIKRINL